MPTAPRKTKEKQPLSLIGGRWYAWTTIRVGKQSRRLREASGFVEADKSKASAWLRRRISETENELLFCAAPEEAAKPAVADFKTAAADYAERGGKRGPLGEQDLAKLITLAEFFGERRCDELDQHAWNDFVDAELDGRAGDT